MTVDPRRADENRPPAPTPIFDTLLVEFGLAWTPEGRPGDRRGHVGWFEPNPATPVWPH